MIKFAHIHEGGKECLIADRRYTDIAVCKRMGKEFYVGYLPYTAQWYAFDKTTGREIANFTKDFYNSFIAPLIVAEADLDHICTPQ